MRRKMHILIIISMMIQLSSYSQTYSCFTTDSEIHEFIKKNKRFFGGNNIDSKILEWHKCDLFKGSYNCWSGDFVQCDSDTIINDKILIDFQSQYYSIEEVKKESFRMLKNKKHKKKYHNISIPIISMDNSIAIIKISYWCGDECALGGILILKRHKNKWKKVDFRCTWMS